MSKKDAFKKMTPDIVKYINRYCREILHEEPEELQEKAEAIYEKMYAETPEIGGGENPMASNLYQFITFCAYYEASDHRIDENSVAYVSKWMLDDQKLVGKFINMNKRSSVRLMNWFFGKAVNIFAKKEASGEWGKTWKIANNPQGRQEGISGALYGCPLLAFAKAHGYENMMPAFCKTDHATATLMHAKLIRFETEASGGSCCDFWYVGDQSETAKKYSNLPII